MNKTIFMQLTEWQSYYYDTEMSPNPDFYKSIIQKKSNVRLIDEPFEPSCEQHHLQKFIIYDSISNNNNT